MYGFDNSPMNNAPPTSQGDAMIHLAIRLGGVETALRTVVTHEKLMVVLNDNRREITETVKLSEDHLGAMIEAQSQLSSQRDQENRAAQDRRINEMMESLTRMAVERDRSIDGRIAEAVKNAMKERDDQHAQARKAIEDKAKDAVRGWRIMFSGGGAVIGGIIAVFALFMAQKMFGWSPF